MPVSRPAGRTALAVLISLTTLASGLIAPTTAGAREVRSTGLQVPNRPGADQQVTLITGDVVVLPGGDPERLVIRPGAGRDVSFTTRRAYGELSVIPSDVSAAVASGGLDRALFEINGLIKDRYDDKSSDSLPVLVTYTGTAKRSTLAGATALPVINGSALRIAKADAPAVLAGLMPAKASSRALAPGLRKIWLDSRRQPSLDQSVPQIGAPAAWQAGYTGKGVTVAVLDTGIDATHPDLAPQVAGEKNFTDEPADDTVGHGTHVASTIAGTAAASAGRYKGVAPDAKLYDGKVCGEFGCQTSDILAGLTWAATDVKAKIVNLSLGGPDTPGIDPLEEAINRLTAQTGTLFVVAAGNDGPAEQTIGSPGSADAALTVGNVDKQNRLADRSSRGPRLGDGAIKPDLTAPGVDIVAAKSKDSTIGEPVGDKYLTLSGTSMATPHVAGAAALLAQQHPSWSANELKAALMGSAKPAPEQNAFEQGAGRVDVARAISRSVIAEPGSVSYEKALWPHDDDAPVSRPVTYRNVGDQPVTLTLSASLTAPDGTAAPAGAIKLSSDVLMVPAGGTATVQAISDTRHDGPAGFYTGRITAAAADVSIVTPVSVEVEGEAYTLTISSIAPDGRPAAEGETWIAGLGSDQQQYVTDPRGTVQVRLPKGEYLVAGTQSVIRADGGRDRYAVVQPQVQLTADRTVVLDARTARPVATKVPRPEAVPVMLEVSFDRTSADGSRTVGSALSVGGEDRLFTAGLGAAMPPEQLSSSVSSVWGAPGPDGDFASSPYLYHLITGVPGVIPTGFDRVVRDNELAAVDQTVNRSRAPLMIKAVAANLPGYPGGFGLGFFYPTPAKVRLYLEAGAVEWFDMLQETRPDPSDPQLPQTVATFFVSRARYQAGRSYRQRFNAATFGPKGGVAAQTGGDFAAGIDAYTDADGHLGDSYIDTGASKLYRNGVQITQSDIYGYVETAGLPAGTASYKFVTSMTRPSYADLSARIDLTWQFRSAADGEQQVVSPLWTVRYRPEVDSRNVASPGAVSTVPLTLDVTQGFTPPRIENVRIQVSGDEGNSWHPAAVVRVDDRHYKAIFRTPAGAAVSLRAQVVDADGNTADQTTYAAYLLR